MRQDRDKSYEDSEKDDFVHKTSNTPQCTKEKIAQKYADIKENKPYQNDPQKQNSDVKWTKEDKQNMKYIISKLGYDPFEDVGLDEFDRKYCFNLLSRYFDTPGILEDGHKKQCVIEITMSYCQCRKITDELNTELSKPDSNEKRITSLTNAKSSIPIFYAVAPSCYISYYFNASVASYTPISDILRKSLRILYHVDVFRLKTLLALFLALFQYY